MKNIKKTLEIFFGLSGSICMLLHARNIINPEAKISLFALAIVSFGFFAGEISEYFLDKNKN